MTYTATTISLSLTKDEEEVLCRLIDYWRKFIRYDLNREYPFALGLDSPDAKDWRHKAVEDYIESPEHQQISDLLHSVLGKLQPRRPALAASAIF